MISWKATVTVLWTLDDSLLGSSLSWESVRQTKQYALNALRHKRPGDAKRNSISKQIANGTR
jgi:hypothetical protein